MVRQHGQQVLRKLWPERFVQTTDFSRNFFPDEPVLRESNSPFEPQLLRRIPSDPMGGESVEQFITKDDPDDLLRGQCFPGFKPSDIERRVLQRLLLPFPALAGRLHDPILKFLQQMGAILREPPENVCSKAAFMRSRFQQL